MYCVRVVCLSAIRPDSGMIRFILACARRTILRFIAEDILSNKNRSRFFDDYFARASGDIH